MNYQSNKLDDDIQPLQKGSNTDIEFECPLGVEYEGKIHSLNSYKVSKVKRVFYIIFSILTCGFLALFAHWFERLYILLNLKKASIQDATKLVVIGEDKSIEIIELRKDNSANEIRFAYRKFGFIYATDKDMFVPIQFDLSVLTMKEIHSNFGEGLTDSAAAHNLDYYGKNLTEIDIKPWYRLLVEEVLNPFYIFQMFSFVVWYLADYAGFAFVVFCFTAISVTLTLLQTRSFLKKLQDMARTEVEVNVFRGKDLATPLKINSSELVPGDIIEIPEGKIMPCDAVLLSGLCVMNEAMLTGESIPVVKNSLPLSSAHYNANEDKQYTIYAGTTCIQSRPQHESHVLGLVNNTGFMTLKGGLVRSMLFPRQSDFKFYTDALKFIALLVAISFVGLIIDFPTFIKDGAYVTFVQGSQLITITVPPSLPACLSVGISYGLQMLRKKNIFCISPNKIIEAGRIKIMCFDKTGTLTEEGLDLYGVRNAFVDKNTQRIHFRKLCGDIQSFGGFIADAKVRRMESKSQTHLKADSMSREELLLNTMSTCHSLTLVNNHLYGDPLDIKMFEATHSQLCEKNVASDIDFGSAEAVVKTTIQASAPSKGLGAPYVENLQSQIIRRFEFTSKLQRMSAIVKTPLDDGFYRMHIKGAPEKIRELCTEESIPERYQDVLAKYTNRGLRVLACASKNLHISEFEATTLERVELEKEFRFVGLLIFENKLKKITPSVIEKLHDALIRPVMVTGDNALTAISVARQCEIVNPTYRVMLGSLQDDPSAPSQKKISWDDLEFPNERIEQSARLDRIDSEEEPEDGDEDDHLILNMKRGGLDIERLPSIADEHLERFSLNPKLLNTENEDLVSWAMTGDAFSYLVTAAGNGDQNAKTMLESVMKKTLVYARMSPDEKALLVKSLRDYHQVMVGMCGDGANDCAALKAANVGISLSEAEASIAAPFTSKTPNISCVVDLLRYGRAALATSIQTFKFMALYSLIEFVTTVSTYYIDVYYQNNAYYYIDGLLCLSLSFTMSFADAYPKLTVFQPTDRLLSLPILLSVFGLGLIQGAFQVYTLYFVQHSEWYHPCESLRNTSAACQENTSLFMVSIPQYVAVALAVNIGKPFRAPFFDNKWFLFAFVALSLTNLGIMITTNKNVLDFMHMDVMPAEFMRFVVIISIINTMLTLGWEWVIVPFASRLNRKHALAQN